MRGAVLAAVVLAGCAGGGGAGADARPETADVAGAEVAATEVAEVPTASGLAGTYGLMLVMSGVSSVPTVGDTVRTSRTVAFGTLAAAGDGWDLEARVCAVDIDSGTTAVRLFLPDRTLARLDPMRVHLAAAGGDGTRLAGGPSADLRGLRLERPVDDPMPVDAADSRIWDQDEDGQPGITVGVTGIVDGQVWVAQRQRITWKDAVPVPGGLEGRVEWVDEQLALGADNEVLLAGRTPLVQDPDRARSRFRLVRVDGADCAWLVAHRTAVFGE